MLGNNLQKTGSDYCPDKVAASVGEYLRCRIPVASRAIAGPDAAIVVVEVVLVDRVD